MKRLYKFNYTVVLFSVFVSFLLSHTVQAKNPYKTALKDWTKTEEVYGREDFYASIKWYATYHSDEFTQAKIKRITDFYGYGDSQTAELRQKEKSEQDDYYRFYVSFYTYDRKFSDLSAKNTVWQLALDVNHQHIKPDKIEAISKDSPFYRALFPYTNVWSQHYVVYFSKKTPVSTTPLKLSVRGPYGHSELKW